MRVYAYLRASTADQDATRARAALAAFATTHQAAVDAWFIENESGATLKRPELFRLLDIAQRGDILLVEQVDRISRLNATDWSALKRTITDQGIRIVALDLPTSHQMLAPHADEFTGRMLDAINAMLLDMLAAVARKDYDDRRRRQAEGIAKAKSQGRFKGRRADTRLHANIAAHLRDGRSYRDIRALLGCSQSTISTVAKTLKAAA